MKIKTKHIITCIKCLFLGLVMALPFIAVLPTALYYGFNQYAKEGNQIKYKYETNEVNSIEDLIVGNEYYNEGTNKYDLFEFLILYQAEIGTIEAETVFEGNILLASERLQIEETLIENENDHQNNEFYAFQDGNMVYVTYTQIGYKIEGNQQYVTNYGIVVDNIIYTNKTFVLSQEMYNWIIDYDNKATFEYLEIFEKVPEKYRTIEKIQEINNQNALEIAFNNVFNTKGFSWVSNSIIATPIYAFVGAFGLTSDLFLSNLIVYWTNILLIYAILNIVLVVFTKLTQLGKKKEED